MKRFEKQIKQSIIKSGSILIIIIFTFSIQGLSMPKKDRPSKPNITLILADDLEYSDLSMRGSKLYETPNIDRLASESVIFSNAYASHPTCAPSHLAIQTGKYPARLKCVNHSYKEMPLEEITIAERLKQSGYKTCHVGKWHLGRESFRPANQGYDETIASNLAGMPASFFYPFKKVRESVFDVPDLADGKPEDYLTDKLTDRAIQFVHENIDEPFFLNLCYYAVHTPIEAKQATVAKYKEKVKNEMVHNNAVYAAMIEHLDSNVGRILERLKELNIDENTIIIFFSDNGDLINVTNNHPLRDAKGSLYQGGFKEPLFIKWPLFQNAGKICDEPVIGHDLYPTILSMAGISINLESNKIDEVDLLPLLKNPKSKIERDALHWHSFPISVHHFANPNRKPGSAIIKGDWKLIELVETPQGLKHHFEL